MKKRSSQYNVATSKLTRHRAEKISAVEGLELSKPLKHEFKRFDQDGLSGEERRSRLRAYFRKVSA